MHVDEIIKLVKNKKGWEIRISREKNSIKLSFDYSTESQQNNIINIDK